MSETRATFFPELHERRHGHSARISQRAQEPGCSATARRNRRPLALVLRGKAGHSVTLPTNGARALALFRDQIAIMSERRSGGFPRVLRSAGKQARKRGKKDSPLRRACGQARERRIADAPAGRVDDARTAHVDGGWRSLSNRNDVLDFFPVVKLETAVDPVGGPLHHMFSMTRDCAFIVEHANSAGWRQGRSAWMSARHKGSLLLLAPRHLQKRSPSPLPVHRRLLVLPRCCG
jgi:hypothetical protein